MASPAFELRRLREKRFFENCESLGDAKRVRAAEASIRRLIDDLLALGRGRAEAATRHAVDVCVRRSSRMDGGWACTLERENTNAQIGRVIDACGFEYHEDSPDQRDW